MDSRSPLSDNTKPGPNPRWPLPNLSPTTRLNVAQRAQLGIRTMLQQLSTLPLWGRISMGCVALFSTCVVCSVCIAGINAGSSSSATNAQRTPTSARIVGAVVATSTAVSASPTATPAPMATHKPTPTSETQLDVSITCAEGTDYTYAKVCVHTVSGATASITVTYCSGQHPKSKLPDKATDAKGNTNWQWTPQTSCKGNTEVFIYAYKGDMSGSASTTFTLR